MILPLMKPPARGVPSKLRPCSESDEALGGVLPTTQDLGALLGSDPPSRLRYVLVDVVERHQAHLRLRPGIGEQPPPVERSSGH